MKTHSISGTVILAALLMGAALAAHGEEDRIQPWEEDPRYWQYQGEPVLLLGGSDQDNPFNHPNLSEHGVEAHLDLLTSAGGNYIRNTMTSRDRIVEENPFFNDDNIYPFHRDPGTGLYDLEQFNDEYWERFRELLEMTAERDIIVQIEVWDRVDYSRDHADYPAEGWSAQPYNPANNVNYTSEESGLPEMVDTHPAQRENPFFRTTPEQEDNPLVLAYQEAFVEKMLSISLEYGHVLYCISNETNESEHWSGYWARFIREKAEEAGVGVEVTEMWDAHDLTHPTHRHTFDHPDLYSYVDISQNNHQEGQTHWDNMQTARAIVSDPPRPVNSVKIYGGERHGAGVVEGTRKFWRNIVGGLASSRFHRPIRPNFTGVGLNELAQTHIRSMRMFEEAFDIFAAEPRNDLLSNRGEDEAYCAAAPGEAYAVYFTDGGSVALDLTDAEGAFRVRWLDILDSEWADGTNVQAGGSIEVIAPGEGQWAAVLSAE